MKVSNKPANIHLCKKKLVIDICKAKQRQNYNSKRIDKEVQTSPTLFLNYLKAKKMMKEKKINNFVEKLIEDKLKRDIDESITKIEENTRNIIESHQIILNRFNLLVKKTFKGNDFLYYLI